MNLEISPKYQMGIVKNINDALFEQFTSYENVETYLMKWYQEDHNDYGHFWENFHIYYRDEERRKIDASKTLHSMEGKLLLQIAIDLGIRTPDYIPSIPFFKNELKSNYKTASSTFEKAFKNAEKDPSLAVGLANAALESIIKEILKDTRIDVAWDRKDTLTKLIKNICTAFGLQANAHLPKEIRTLASSFISIGNAIEDLRSDKTIMHGKTDGDTIITEPAYAYLVINATTTVGLFLLNLYKLKYPPITKLEDNLTDDLPF